MTNPNTEARTSLTVELASLLGEVRDALAVAADDPGDLDGSDAYALAKRLRAVIAPEGTPHGMIFDLMEKLYEAVGEYGVDGRDLAEADALIARITAALSTPTPTRVEDAHRPPPCTWTRVPTYGIHSTFRTECGEETSFRHGRATACCFCAGPLIEGDASND